VQEVRKLGIETQAIPGIPSFTAAAAAAGSPIALRDEHIYLTDGGVNESVLQNVHTVCILKPRRKIAETLETLEKYNFRYTYIKHCSLPQETILDKREAILQDHEYISLVIAKKEEC
jgi:precorrin-2 methylase